MAESSPPPPTRIYNYPVFRNDLKRPKESHFQLSGSRMMAPLLLPATFAIPVSFAPYDQGQIGSCVANSTVAAYRIMEPSLQTASRMFVYTAGKIRENELKQDGMMLDDGLECLRDIGVCPENLCPYSNVLVAQYQRPSATAYTAAAANKIKGFGKVTVDTINALKRVLVNNVPVLIGIAVYSSFEQVTSDGFIPIPNKSRESFLGGHALCIVGYDDIKQAALVLNSWGTAWGTSHPAGSDSSIRGYCWIPYQYLMDPTLTDEFLFSTGPVIPPPPPPPPPKPPAPVNPAKPKPKPRPRPVRNIVKKKTPPKPRHPRNNVAMKH